MLRIQAYPAPISDIEKRMSAAGITNPTHDLAKKQSALQSSKHIHVMHRRPLLSAGLATLLASPGWRITLHCQQPSASVSADIVVADYETAIQILDASASYKQPQDVLVITARDKPFEIRQALSSRVAGYVLEDVSKTELHLAVCTILNKARYLSPVVVKRIYKCELREQITNRERDVLNLMAEGLCNKSIARLLEIGLGTVKTHARSLMMKMGAQSRTHAVVIAAQLGLVGIDTPDHPNIARET